MKEVNLELPGELNPEEVTALRRFEHELRGSGYAVKKLSLAPGGYPLAIVARREDGKKPLRTFVAACRSLLRASEEIDLGEEISSEEAETIAAASLTIRTARWKLKVKKPSKLGEEAHLEMANAVQDKVNQS